MPRRPSRAIVALAGVPVMLVLAPIAVTLWQALHAGLSNIVIFAQSPASLPLLLNTCELTVAAAALAMTIGTLAALLVVRSAVPMRWLWLSAGAAPLAVPAFVMSYAWVSISPWFEGFGGALLVVTCAYYPLVFLPTMAALRRMDAALEENARVLGLTAQQAVFRIVLPQLRPAIFGGGTLVALNVLVEYGAFAMMRFHTFTTQIFLAFTLGMDQRITAALSMALLALCLIVLGLNGAFDRQAHAPAPRGAARRQEPLALGRWRWPAFAFLAALSGASIGVPLVTVLYWLTRHGASAVSPALADVPNVVAATATSVKLGLEAALLTCSLAFPLALVSARHAEQGWVRTMGRGAWLAQGLPGIVIALSFIAIALHLVPALYQTTLLLILAYAILFMSFALVSIRAALEQTPAALEEAGRMLGDGRLGVLRRITLPLALPGIGAAGALVFTAVVSELTATLLLIPLGQHTLSTRVWEDISTLSYGAAAPFAVVLIALSALASWVTVLQFGKTVRTGG